MERQQPVWDSRAVWLGFCLLPALTLGLLYIIIHGGLWLQVCPRALLLFYAPFGSSALKGFPLKDIACLYFRLCSL